MNPEPYQEHPMNEDEYRTMDYDTWNKLMSELDWTTSETKKQLDKKVEQLTIDLQTNELIIKEQKELINKMKLSLNRPWYLKLWNRIPRFSLSIRRTN